METLTAESTANQRRLIHQLCNYDAELKQQLVYELTQGRTTTSLEITKDEAKQLIDALQIHWARFDKHKKQHQYILSLLKQIGWSKTSDRYGIIADMDRLSNFLKSNRSPVRKPLQSMDSIETSKLINCLESMLGKKYSK